MDIDCLPLEKTGFFSKLICDYSIADVNLKQLYNRFPDIEGFKGQIEEKGRHFTQAQRDVLYCSMKNQYQNTDISKDTAANIELLKENNTFTVVTGHQLNLFTGPLYFLYKIISTINLTKQLKTEFPNSNFVPIYWVATEDHDFDEINYFNFKGLKFQWNKEASGAVGHLPTEGLEEVFTLFSKTIGDSKNAKVLKVLFENAYLKHDNLTDATRYLANEIFKDYGLVIVDGDDVDLKRTLIPYIKKDIFEQTAFYNVSKTIEEIEQISSDYPVQVNPREINYFYLKDGIRERIIENKGKYIVNETAISFTKEELINEMNVHPERFSPNVIARPLYQEVILPNLCYIGGGGEIAYWLELKAAFEAMEVPFPILLVRNSALIITEKQADKLEKMNISKTDIFLKQNSLINKKIREISNIDIDFSSQKKLLEEQFKEMYAIAEITDKSFLGAVKAQEVKQKKGLDALEKRLLQAQKRKLKDHVVRMTALQNELFPTQSLQERQSNFSEFYLEYGEDLIPMLFKALNPLDLSFTVITQ
ncbi:bacillithiol biosynthesis cysteine-adding enzyme BshC [Maribacter hydrothermalis]|uniref:Putative cysteine ligase BshC n=1 Tax=Maribacter hydrothermalis TaxID=1836467 RepID=A0A1B7ZBH9_9FLAO|nr:bacillithiol biosynthesis cysteine-adding enzyme BshC [Maribacter hydrothermalis]APQ16368.1 bacillithiol biosynthesis cysteine-adding enzyme BshC [Maribacter hydrothermalis]OBR40063.1 bacillithiol biosynthesis cysteine-adding enzyme BshC [Maribacter hydrothermalis]